MASIFSSFQSQKFWMKYSFVHSSDTSSPLMAGPLQVKKGSLLVTHNFQLTATALIELDLQGIPKKLTHLNWKLLDPFFEKTPKGTLYGFRLSDKDFFVDSASTLEK